MRPIPAPGLSESVFVLNQGALLRKGLKGVEKESLRLSSDGLIANTNHPSYLGSALTHPYITTDYSEALLEFITPPFSDFAETLTFLNEVHRFVHSNLNGEILLSTSMPCGIDGDESIRIAEYGSSNIGRMKHLYRKGLCRRYGRSMQAIAGIHFNYSVPETLWPMLKALKKSQLKLVDFVADAYFGLIRNFLYQGWVLVYLFGASPAVSKQYFKNRPELMGQFKAFDGETLYASHATSLRMSDIGYYSKNQAGLDIDYNSLTAYTESLRAATETPLSDYQNIGVKRDNVYLQLNANILQIENEFYNSIRPKQPIQSGEKPSLALKQRGIHYIEIRSLDVNPFAPTGIDEQQGLFLEAFLIHCLLQESPLQTAHQQQINRSNQLTVAKEGRRPGLILNDMGKAIRLTDWAKQILGTMTPVCAALDYGLSGKPYSQALLNQLAIIEDADLTPSAKMLSQMRENRQSFTQFALAQSAIYQSSFALSTLDTKRQSYFNQLAIQSHRQQKKLEQTQTLSFDDFLQHYFAQQ